MVGTIDILENDILEFSKEILEILLFDHTTKRNISWCTDNYEHLGSDYQFSSEIKIESVTGENGNIIMPRVKKELTLQLSRVKEKAEVFTPSWVCNAQNNLIDNSWFGRENVFNREINDTKGRRWITNSEKITFPKDKTWEDYVRMTVLEISCGEAPYITSRYDATTGIFIPIEDRIGLLDRKLRIVGENVNEPSDWLKFTEIAYQSTYAYEWQGDSLLLTREAMLYTFIEYFKYKFDIEPSLKSIKKIAHIISWNVWQMDGLKCIVPESCKTHEFISKDLFGSKTINKVTCEGCAKNDTKKHNGIYCIIKDWNGTLDEIARKKGKEIRFVDLLK